MPSAIELLGSKAKSNACTKNSYNYPQHNAQIRGQKHCEFVHFLQSLQKTIFFLKMPSFLGVLKTVIYSSAKRADYCNTKKSA
jgi:hypothetical protein